MGVIMTDAAERPSSRSRPLVLAAAAFAASTLPPARTSRVLRSASDCRSPFGLDSWLVGAVGSPHPGRQTLVADSVTGLSNPETKDKALRYRTLGRGAQTLARNDR